MKPVRTAIARAAWLLVLACPAALPASCGGEEPAPAVSARGAGQPPPAGSAVATRERVPVRREVSATVRSLDHILVSSEVAGRVLAVHADVGDRVTADQLLAELDPRLQESALGAARAALDLAEAESGRVARLLEQKVASSREHDAALSALRKAQADLEAAETALSRTQVRAPVDAVVEHRHVGAGDLAVPGARLYSLYDPARMCLEAYLPVGDREHARLGTVLAWRFEGRAGEGAVYEVAPSSDPRSRSFRIRVPLPGGLSSAGSELAPGMFGTLAYQVGESERVSVPEGAVFVVGQVEMVRVTDGEQWVRRAVRTGARLEGRVEILSGLRGGERVGLR